MRAAKRSSGLMDPFTTAALLTTITIFLFSLGSIQEVRDLKSPIQVMFSGAVLGSLSSPFQGSFRGLSFSDFNNSVVIPWKASGLSPSRINDKAYQIRPVRWEELFRARRRNISPAGSERAKKRFLTASLRMLPRRIVLN